MNNAVYANRSLGEIVSEIRVEFIELVDTRLKMLKSELQEAKAGLRVALPLAALTLILLVTAFLLLSAAVVTLIASAFAGNPYAWFFGLIIVAALWAVFGAIAGFFAYNALRAKATFPRRTFEVLNADKKWLQSEAKETYDRAA